MFDSIHHIDIEYPSTGPSPSSLFLRVVLAAVAVTLYALAATGSARAQTTVGPFTFTPTSTSGVLQGQAEIDGVPAAAGDIVGVIDGSGSTAGAAEVIMNGGVAFINVTIYGDDSTTPGVDEGMSPGEGFTLKLWDASAGATLDGPSLSGWSNTNGAPMPGFDDPNTVYAFAGLLQAPAAPVLTSPADGATGLSLTPTLAWTNVADAATYDVEVSTDAGFGSTVFSTAGTAATQTIASGLDFSTDYFWRVRAVNAAGSSAFSAARSFTTRQAVVPPAPELTVPANGIQNAPLVVDFSWGASSDATAYEIQVATDGAFTTVVEVAAGLTATSYSATLPDHLTQYFWRVQASGPGGVGPWSSVFSFMTIAPDPPTAPPLTSPADGATGVDLSPTLSWAFLGSNVTYEVQVATGDDFSNLVTSAMNITAASFEATGLETLTTYFWRVRGTNAGGTGPWSAVRSFETVLPDVPPAAQLVGPEDGAENAPTATSLRWTALAEATSYDVQWATDSGFTENQFTEEGLAFADTGTGGSGPGGEAGSVLSFLPPFLANDVQYFWRVRARNAGGAGPWSEVRSFTTIVAAPGVAQPVSPGNGAEGQSVALTLSFQAAPRAALHDIQLATDQAFTDVVAGAAGHSETGFDVQDLAPATMYFWRVRGTNVGGTGPWSAVQWFETVVAAPAAPAPLAPQNGEEAVPRPVGLSWTPVPGAATFTVQVAVDDTFLDAEGIISATTISTGTLEVAGLASETTYFWRVRAANAGGESAWSATWQFTTLVAAPGATVLSLPADGATEMDLAPTLDWVAASASGTVLYDVEVGTDASFQNANTLVFADTRAETQVVLPDLAFMTTYYWRVRAGNEAGSGPWSDIRSFTTRLPPAPSAPGPLTPADGAADVSVTLLLTWVPQVLAATYDVQVSASSQFVPLVFQASGVEATEVLTDSLGFETTYFWRVRASNAGGTGAWSVPITFMTMALPPPSAVDLTEPADKVLGVPSTFTLRWDPLPIAEKYDLQLSRFGALVLDTTGVAGTSLDVSGLEGDTEYFWRVRARNSAGTGPWSPSFSFRTALFTGTEHPGATAHGDTALPVRLALPAAWPNPFSERATLRLELPMSGSVRVEVIDMLGRRRGLVLERDLPAGRHEVAFQAAALGLGGGTYLIRLTQGGAVTTRLLTHLP